MFDGNRNDVLIVASAMCEHGCYVMKSTMRILMKSTMRICSTRS